MADYGCSFCLLLENESIAQCRPTVDSLLGFIATSPIVCRKHSEVLCVGKAVDTRYSGALPPALRVIGPDQWTLPGETGDYYGPEIVRCFAIATRRAGEMIIIIAPGRTIRDASALEDAIFAVATERKLLAVSHDLRNNHLPDAAVLAHSATIGATRGAAGWNGVEVKKRFFGGVDYRYRERTNIPDVPWLISAIAAEFALDRNGVGQRVEVSRWV